MHLHHEVMKRGGRQLKLSVNGVLPYKRFNLDYYFFSTLHGPQSGTGGSLVQRLLRTIDPWMRCSLFS